MEENEYEAIDLAYANAEIRSLTLELMKIASREKKPFKQVVHEFIENTFYLKRILEEHAER
jgi:hypothetical protein